MAAEVRLSPDQTMVAIRSVYPENGPLAWGYIHTTNGGGWMTQEQVAEWTVLEVPEPAPPAEEPV